MTVGVIKGILPVNQAAVIPLKKDILRASRSHRSRLQADILFSTEHLIRSGIQCVVRRIFETGGIAA